MPDERPEVPAEFQEVLRSIKHARARREVRLVETPAPSRIAPYAVAVDGEASYGGEAVASGRFVVLHDPAGQGAWEGTLRVIALARASVEAEVGQDELWAGAAWSWMRDALAPTPHRALGGTVTKVVNESFGDLAERSPEVTIEIRATWTPLTPDMSAHLSAWTDLLALCGGIPPLPDGVAALPGKTG